MKLPVNIPTAILIALVVFYSFIVFSHFTKNLREGLENQEEGEEKEEDLEEIPDSPSEEENIEDEESMLEKMTRLESEIADLQSEISTRTVDLDKLKKQVDVAAEEPVKE